MATDHYGDTPRMIAVRHNHLECMKTIDEHERLNVKKLDKINE